MKEKKYDGIKPRLTQKEMLFCHKYVELRDPVQAFNLVYAPLKMYSRAYHKAMLIIHKPYIVLYLNLLLLLQQMSGSIDRTLIIAELKRILYNSSEQDTPTKFQAIDRLIKMTAPIPDELVGSLGLTGTIRIVQD